MGRITTLYSYARRVMNRQFKKRGYDLENKRYIIYHAIGYLPNFTDLTLDEMLKIIEYMKEMDKSG